MNTLVAFLGFVGPLAFAIIVVACDSGDDVSSPSSPVIDAGDVNDGAIVDDAIVDGASLDAPEAIVDASPVPITCAVSPCALEIVTGATSACVRLDDGTVRCWGSNGAGELGRGPDGGGGVPSPAPVVGLATVTQLAGAPSDPGDAYCARRADGSAVCWGANGRGILGRTIDGGADTASSPVAMPVEGIAAATGVFVGPSVACATLAGADVACWGTSSAGQIPGKNALATATTFALPAPTASLAISDRGTVALASSGALFSWGLRGAAIGPTTGVLGREVSLDVAPPGPIVLARVSAIAGSVGRVCAIANGRVNCWGNGPTSSSDSVYPTPVGIGGTVAIAQSLAVGPTSVCATLSDGTASCWGNNAKGQLGNGNTDLQPLPVTVVGLASRPVRIAVMAAATCALLETGAIQCWGDNTRGQLGTGTPDALGHLVPTTVELSP